MKKSYIFLLITVWLTASVFAGVEWSSRITVTDNEKGRTEEMTSVVYAQGGDVKQVFKDVPKSQRRQYIDEGYWLYKGDQDTLYIVDDKGKTITPLSLDALQRMGDLAGGIVKIEIRDQQVNTEWLGEDKVLGLPCRHMKIVTDYTMEIKVAVIKKTMIVHQEREIWASTAVKGLEQAAQPFLKRDFRTGFAELDEMIKAEMQRMKESGVPLKSITRMVQKNKKGKVSGDTTTTVEVTGIDHKDLPAAIFELPADYRMQEGV